MYCFSSTQYLNFKIVNFDLPLSFKSFNVELFFKFENKKIKPFGPRLLLMIFNSFKLGSDNKLLKNFKSIEKLMKLSFEKLIKIKIKILTIHLN